MDKILISVYILAIDEEYDMFIPINENIAIIIELIQNTIKDLSGKYYQVNPKALLYNSIDGNIINNNNIVKLSGLKNGARLLLI